MMKIEAAAATATAPASHNEAQSPDNKGGRYVTVWMPDGGDPEPPRGLLTASLIKVLQPGRNRRKHATSLWLHGYCDPCKEWNGCAGAGVEQRMSNLHRRGSTPATLSAPCL